jgi:hypothetical protein
MTRIIVHAGQPKTGTSSIQEFLVQNREEFLKLGYLFPVSGATINGNHAHLVRRMVGLTVPPRHEACLDEFLDEIRQHPGRNVLISSESTWGFFTNGRSHQDIVKFLHQISNEIELILYVRDDAEQINSAYGQMVKTFFEGSDFESFTIDRVKRNKVYYPRLLDATSSEHVSLTARPFNKELQKRGVIRDFVSLLGFSGDEFKNLDHRVNETIGPIGIAIAREVMRRIAEMQQKISDRQRGALQRALLRHLSGGDMSEPSYCGMNDGLRRYVRENLAPEQDEFAKSVWKNSWEEIFGQDSRKNNEFNLIQADLRSRENYDRILSLVWQEAESILNNKNIAADNPWDTSARRR